VALQATAGDGGQSQLHRRVLGRATGCWGVEPDGSGAALRLHDRRIEQFDGSKTDAALLFPSAASALMLATALLRLTAGDLAIASRDQRAAVS
jgi:hypothetical protein